MVNNTTDISGQKFGRLTAISYVSKDDYKEKVIKHDNSALWKCLCDCGNTIITRRSLLRTGRSQSCGCVRIERIKTTLKSRRPQGKHSAIRRKYFAYKFNAEKRNLAFPVSVETFGILLIGNCHYCNAIPNQRTCIYRSQDEENTLIHNGVDRLDNNLGYIEGNMVSCCSRCNWLKSNFSLPEFKEHIMKIVNHSKWS